MRLLARVASLCFVWALTLSNAFSNEPSLDECQISRDLIILDRTSEFSNEEHAAFERGLRQIIVLNGSEGSIEIVEVKDRTAGYYSHFEGCLRGRKNPYAKCVVDSSTDNSSLPFLTQIWATLVDSFTEESPAEQRAQLQCENNHAVFERRNEQHRSRIFEKVLDSIGQEVKTETTNLIDSFAEIISSRCELRNCRVQIFSNLIESRLNRLELEPEYALKLGQTEFGARLRERGFYGTVDSVAVWGFGNSDRGFPVKDDLDPKFRRILTNFWRGAFSELIDGFVPIGFDYER